MISLILITLAFTLSYGETTLKANTNFNKIEVCVKPQERGTLQHGWVLCSGESNEEFGHTAPCKISISTTNETTRCRHQRSQSVTMKRKYYSLTAKGKKNSIEFPWGDKIPFLNQTMDAVRFHTAYDEIDSKWMSVINSTKEDIQRRALKHMMKNRKFESLDDYKEIYRDHINDVNEMKESTYIASPIIESNFTPMFDNDSWMLDDLFVQQRLAGPCPFLIKLVTVDGSAGMKWEDLKAMLNQTYDFNAAVRSALQAERFTLDNAVKNNMIYVLYNKDNNVVKARSEDFFYGMHRAQLQQLTSPITLFVRTPAGTLKVVAIQMDYSKESEVFSPASDNVSWMLAKSMVNLADANYCQSVWHLSHVHLSSSVYCNIFRGHFSELHPLYHIMRHHCEGTVPHIALSWPTLVGKASPGDKYSAMGSEGFATLTLNGKSQYRYGLLSYDDILKSHGLDSKQINYHPFRDDGEVLWTEFQWFANEFVNIFYKTDSDIVNDEELQSFANEVSADGKKAPFGGRGKINGFPSSFRTKEELNVFIARFIWLIAMHAAVNYPIEPWYTFVPLSPAKLFENTMTHEKKNLAFALPDAATTVGGLAYSTLLGNLRINRIMDHFDKIRHDKLNSLIKYHHDHLHSTIQRKLETRNNEREANQKMGFRYFEPKWLTNSIHI